MDEPKKYQSVPIPMRKSRNEKTAVHVESHEIETPFAELEITADPQIQSPPQIQKIDRNEDAARARFYAMRRFARENAPLSSDESRIFYYQAIFMRDYEDDFPENTPFDSHFPNYHQMDYRQLRSYFAWRSNVRRGVISEAPTSFAFLHIYELICCIETDNPQDAAERLIRFWRAFRKFDDVIDRYVLQWLKDLHVFYPDMGDFRDFAEKAHLIPYYPIVFAFGSDRVTSFALFSGISGYNIAKSPFLTNDTRVVINNCFYFILSNLRDAFNKHGILFESLLFFINETESVWLPFPRSLFYSELRQGDRQVSLSEFEHYRCKANCWTYKSVVPTDQGRQIIGFILRKMESELRLKLGFKKRLAVKPMDFPKDFEKVGVNLPLLIRKCVDNFYALFTRKSVAVDVHSLEQIRKNAAETTEKLIVPEKDVVLNENKPKLPEIPPAKPTSNPWIAFRDILTENELTALRIILQGGSLKAFATEAMLMPEVLTDEINQKAMDIIGDTLIDIDSDYSAQIYDDYIKNLTKVVE